MVIIFLENLLNETGVLVLVSLLLCIFLDSPHTLS